MGLVSTHSPDTFSGSYPAPHPCSALDLVPHPLPLLSLLGQLLPLAPEDPGPQSRPRAGIPNLPVLPLQPSHFQPP